MLWAKNIIRSHHFIGLFLFIIRERWRNTCISLTTPRFRVEANVIILRKLQFCTSVEQDLCCCISIFFALKTLTFYKDFLWNRILLSRLEWEKLFFLVRFSTRAKFTRWIAFLKTDTVMYLKNDNFHTQLSQLLSLVRFDGHIHCNTLCKQITESLYIFF